MSEENEYIEDRNHNPRVKYEKENAVLRQDLKETRADVKKLLLWKAEHKTQAENDQNDLVKHEKTLYDTKDGVVTKQIQLETALYTIKWIIGIFGGIVGLILTLDKIFGK